MGSSSSLTGGMSVGSKVMLLLCLQGMFLPTALADAPVDGAGPSSLQTLPGSPLLGPELSVTLSPSMRVSHVTSSQNGAVVFGGNVTVERLTTMSRVTVTLTGACEWTTLLSPSTMVFMTSVPQSFCVTVVVPPATERDRSSSVVVNAVGTALGGFTMEAQAEATVTVAPYYNAYLALPIEAVVARRGSTAAFKCNLSNTCNGPMGFQIQLQSPPEGVSLRPITVSSMAQFEIRDVELEIDVSRGAALGRHDLTVLIVFSGDAPGANPVVQTMKVEVVAATEGAGAPIGIVVAIVVVAAVAVLYLRISKRRRGG